MKKLEGKVAVVTGGSSGIGKEICKTFAREGAKVAVAARNLERGGKVAEDIKAAGGDAVFIRTDVRSEEDVKALIQKTAEIYGGIDVLVNNAGISLNASLEDTTDEQWNNIINTNLRSAFYAMKYAVPYLLESKGSVVTIASYAGIVPNETLFAYAPSKAGVAMLTKVFAVAYAPKGVRANVISPGVVDTPILNGVPKEIIEAYANQATPLRRLGQPSDIASAALFLASDDASWITGQNLSVDGGSTLL